MLEKDNNPNDYTLNKIKFLKEASNQIAIRRGCNNTNGCFCTGKCQEIVGWREKTLEERNFT